jgi:hypothetical protein
VASRAVCFELSACACCKMRKGRTPQVITWGVSLRERRDWSLLDGSLLKSFFPATVLLPGDHYCAGIHNFHPGGMRSGSLIE